MPQSSNQEDEMADATILTCPKCRGEMRTYERNGILIDQCEECRGIFLDRGELEQLLDAERGNARGDEREDGYDDHHRGHDHDDDRHRDHHDDDDKRRRGRRRTSPTQLLSDFLGGGE
jgi:Zn-finger nucleic acid-binding protein